MSAYEFLYQEELYKATDTIVIAVSEPWESLKEEDKTLLSKILGSVKISLDQVQVIHASSTDLKSLQVYNPAKVIAFGTIIKESSALYACQTINGVSFIASESLATLDDARKKSLWGGLRQMFA